MCKDTPTPSYQAVTRAADLRGFQVETVTPMAQVATSSSLFVAPRKLLISLSREDLDKLNLALCVDEDFTLGPQDGYMLVFARRQGYWPEESHPQ